MFGCRQMGAQGPARAGRPQGLLIWPINRTVPGDRDGLKSSQCNQQHSKVKFLASIPQSTRNREHHVPVWLCLMRNRKGLSTVTQGGEERASKMAAEHNRNAAVKQLYSHYISIQPFARLNIGVQTETTHWWQLLLLFHLH